MELVKNYTRTPPSPENRDDIKNFNMTLFSLKRPPHRIPPIATLHQTLKNLVYIYTLVFYSKKQGTNSGHIFHGT